MAAPPLRFATGDLEVVLAAHDLPEPPIQWGGSHRKTVTRYARDWVSVQSHGIDLELVEIEGELKDSRWVPGHAQQVRQNLDAMMTARRIVLLEYDSDKLWGSFEVTFEEIRRDFVRYAISFEPLWREDPEFQTFFDFEQTPEAARGRLTQLVDDTVEFGLDPPSSIIDTGFLSQAQLELLSLQNSVNGALSVLQEVANFQEMSLDTHKLVIRGLRRGLNALQLGIERNESIAIEAISSPGARLSASADFVWTLQSKQRLTRAEIFSLIRRILAETRPVSRRRYLVRDGDTLQSIAERELGDFTRWIEIADANDLDTTDVTVGQLLVLPRR